MARSVTKRAFEVACAYEVLACNTPLPTYTRLAGWLRRSVTGRLTLAATCTVLTVIAWWHLWTAPI